MQQLLRARVNLFAAITRIVLAILFMVGLGASIGWIFDAAVFGALVGGTIATGLILVVNTR